MRRGVLVRLLTLALAPVAVLRGAQAPAVRLAAVLEGVGAAVDRYFSRAQSLICTETVSLQTVGFDMNPDQTPMRRLIYEMRMTRPPSVNGEAPEATVERQLLRIGGRAPRPKDKPGCMDPKEASPEPLSFLLPSKQGESTFTFAGSGRVNGRPAVMLDYRARDVGPITSTMSSEDCWSIDLPGRQRGRVWIDPETFDVLRIDERLTGMFDVTLPQARNRRSDQQTITVERLDSSTLYRPVVFTDPDETVMLPRSVESLQVVRNSGAPRVRKTQVFSNYRRFITSGRIVQ